MKEEVVVIHNKALYSKARAMKYQEHTYVRESVGKLNLEINFCDLLSYKLEMQR